MYSPCGTCVEVLLKIRFEGTRFSGQRNFAAGGSPPSSSINPLIGNRFPQKTEAATSSLLLVFISSRQKMRPCAGSRDASDLSLQTTNCRLPPEVMTMGELLEACSSSAFQTSFPVSLSSARTVAPGLAPVNTIRKEPSIKGEGQQPISSTVYSSQRFFSQKTFPVLTSSAFRICSSPARVRPCGRFLVCGASGRICWAFREFVFPGILTGNGVKQCL